jgi:hypothetical protein
MNGYKTNYQEVSTTHSPVIAEYVLEHLPENQREEFKRKGVDTEVVENLIEQWLVL